MRIVTDKIEMQELRSMMPNWFGDMVKGVVDVERELLALDAELHADLEGLLLQSGSEQKNLWGINLHPEQSTDEFVEFDSLINIRPAHGNRGRGVENHLIRERVLEIVGKRIVR